MRRSPAILAAALGLIVTAQSGQAQDDVVELGRIHGTTPPASYYRELARNPRAFQFTRAWMRRNPRLLVTERGDAPPLVELRPRASGPAGAPRTAGPAAVGPRSVEGPVAFPLLLGIYSDTPPPEFTRDWIQAEYFDGPNSRYKTIPEFYAEISGGRVQVSGRTFDWAASSLSRATVTGGVSALGSPGQVGGFIEDLLEVADDGTVDWGAFDSDGPDGLPNSGDDDGFVDVIAVFHPDWGAECGGAGSSNRVWSHKWSLRFAPGASGSYRTLTPAAGGGFIRVDDYTIQPMFSCGGNSGNVEIGVFAHELGHGFGLPDLYCTASGCGHEGIGRWGLMGSGSWGCSAPSSPERPCHMSAWSKSMLGWVEVETLQPGQDLGTRLLEPVETTGTVLRVDAGDGSGEYFLLENRQPIGFDELLFAPGLLIWQIDEPFVNARWPGNAVNASEDHLGVWLRQADGLGNVEDPGPAGNRGDSGDPFPGSSRSTAFHAGTVPGSLTHLGSASGLTLLDITDVGQDVEFQALTRFQTIQLRTEGEQTGGLLSVDGQALPGMEPTFASAPFESHILEAAGGEPLGEGRRRPFDGWADEPGSGRIRFLTTGLEDAEFVARYAGVQLAVAMDIEGEQFGVAPGRVVSVPTSEDLWFPEGTEVQLTAEATPGFDFLEWTGALAGAPNPTTVLVDAPVSAGARFDYTFGLPDEMPVPLEAATDPLATLTIADGTPPFVFQRVGGVLPRGLTLESDGSFSGPPMEEGDFPVDLMISDALGLQAQGRVRVEVGPPALSLPRLAQPLLGSSAMAPTPLQLTFFDVAGNRDGRYDVGDLRSFLVDHPGFSGSTVAAEGEIVVPVVRIRSGAGR